MLYDLSHPLSNKIASFPGTPPPNIEQLARIDVEGWNSKRLQINSHYSTHIDAPSHMVKNGKTLDDYPIDKFVGTAIVLDARNMNKIKLSTSQIKKGDFVFLFTGWSDKIYSEDYYTNPPFIDPDFAQELVNKKISIIGMDSASPDDEPYALHFLFFNNDILIVENLTNLQALVNKRFKCIIAPLKIEKADGAPCRVIAEV
jgi:kynurenine formamidase